MHRNILYKIIYLLFLSSFYSFAQINSCQITYGLIIADDDLVSKDKKINDLFKKGQVGANKLFFELNANNEESLFKLKEKINDQESEMAQMLTLATNVYYVTSKSDEKIKQLNNHLGQYIINYTNKTEWKLTNESKYIDSHLCFKATAEQVVTYSKATYTHPIIAWYCPSIPFNFGPIGYNGLPGLILELQERFAIYGAKKIDLKTVNIIIEKPNKGKIVTEAEFSAMLKGFVPN